MIKFIKRLILLSLLLGGGFLFVSMQDGGGAFRRFGDTVKGRAEEVAGSADSIKESADGVRKTAGEAVESIRRTVEALRETASGFASLFGEEKEEESAPEETRGMSQGAAFSAAGPAPTQAVPGREAALRDD